MTKVVEVTEMGATDVQDELSSCDKHYTSIVVCAGSNDCSKSEMDIEGVNENVSTLIYDMAIADVP